MTTTTCVSQTGIAARMSELLAKTLGARRYAMWFDRSACFDYCDDNQTLRVVVPNRFVADWIARNFHQDLQDLIESELGKGISLDLHVDPQRFNREEILRSDSSDPTRQAELRSTGRSYDNHHCDESGKRQPAAGPCASAGSLSRHRLENFIVGPCNELAFAAANRIVDDQAMPAHPLFIHGGCGLGKTHLLQGICRRMLSLHPQAKVLYATGEQFTNEYINAVRKNNLEAFRRKMRKLDLLAVDDIHFIANKQATQQEFLHSFNEIELGGSKLVLASDCHPKLIQQLSAALVSRCVRGLVVQIKPPDSQTRLKMIQQLAKRRGMVILDQVAEHIAARCEATVRDIEGILTKIHALATLVRNGVNPHVSDSQFHHTQTTFAANPIGYSLVDRVFDDGEILHRPNRPVQFETILNEVCRQVGVSTRQVMDANRHKSVVLARSLTIYLARKLTSMSYPEIAVAMGRNNHSTIITAAKRMQKMVEENQPLILPNDHSELRPTALIEQLKRRIIKANAS